MTEDPIAGFRRIRITWERGVTRLHLNRPERRNAIDLRLAQELLRASLLERTASSGCVLLTGAGEHFCVGGDLKAFEAADDLPSHLMEVTSYLHAALSRFAAMPAPWSSPPGGMSPAPVWDSPAWPMYCSPTSTPLSARPTVPWA